MGTSVKDRGRVRGRSAGWTLGELLVSLAIVSLLAALLLPAIQAAREAARRITCQRNLHSIGQGMLAWEAARGTLPPAAISGNQMTEAHRRLGIAPGVSHNWAALLLPYFDQVPFSDAYQVNVDWRAEPNRTVRESRLPLLVCPSTPRGTKWDEVSSAVFGPWRAATGDYAPDYGVDSDLGRTGLIDAGSAQRPEGVLGVNEVVVLAQITDGTSHTLCLVEDAGRPRRYATSLKLPVPGRASGGGWADPQGAFVTHGSRRGDGTTGPRDCALNCTNDNEIFAFHAGGAFAVAADGSTRFLADEIELRCLARLLTRAAGDGTDS